MSEQSELVRMSAAEIGHHWGREIRMADDFAAWRFINERGMAFANELRKQCPGMPNVELMRKVGTAMGAAMDVHESYAGERGEYIQ